eukprot:4421098-Prymnesium_polylepis.1
MEAEGLLVGRVRHLPVVPLAARVERGQQPQQRVDVDKRAVAHEHEPRDVRSRRAATPDELTERVHVRHRQVRPTPPRVARRQVDVAVRREVVGDVDGRVGEDEHVRDAACPAVQHDAHAQVVVATAADDHEHDVRRPLQQ